MIIWQYHDQQLILKIPEVLFSKQHTTNTGGLFWEDNNFFQNTLLPLYDYVYPANNFFNENTVVIFVQSNIRGQMRMCRTHTIDE